MQILEADSALVAMCEHTLSAGLLWKTLKLCFILLCIPSIAHILKTASYGIRTSEVRNATDVLLVLSHLAVFVFMWMK